MVCPGFLYLELHGGSCTVVQNSLGRLHFMVFDGNNAARQKSSWSRTCPTVCNLLCHKERRKPFGISQSICTRTLRNLTRYLHWNPPGPYQASSPPKPSGTSRRICPGTLRNLTTHLHLVPPEPHQVPAPKPSRT